MKRNISLEEISDGNLYRKNDMVKMGTAGCADCCACCRGMGNSIILDPWDVWELVRHLGLNFGELMQTGVIELNVVDGMILPNLKMQEGTDACRFLNDDKRCEIHEFRPGFCRLFPLGRYYKEDSDNFYYILQKHECAKQGKTKEKVSHWLNIPDLKRYEEYIMEWHRLQKEFQALMEGKNIETVRSLNMYLVQQFFLKPFYPEDFYGQFEERMKEVREAWEEYR
ncbi:MAG: YkgJ family cysteine cluster protein [Clostridiales bacterium]|nr:YkgJ family cysteine cluster protein [Clostridiales bacterium]